MHTTNTYSVTRKLDRSITCGFLKDPVVNPLDDALILTIKILIVLLAIIISTAAVGSEPIEQKSVKVSSIMGEKIVRLEDGRNIELSGIMIPQENKIKAAKILQDELFGKNVEIHANSEKVNRHGNIAAQLKSDDGIWAQKSLLEAGLGYVYPSLDNALFLKDLLGFERQAMQDKSGMWKDDGFRVLTTDEVEKNLLKYRNKFGIVEGKVKDVKKTKNRYYINFSEDWKTDFSITIVKTDFKNFKNVNLGSLIGSNIRVRGWIESRNGPFIRIADPSFIEVLSADNSSPPDRFSSLN